MLTAMGQTLCSGELIAMPESWLTLLPVALNAVIIIAIVLLWIMWWRNARRQYHLNSMLVESSRQLTEASELLDQALAQIKELKQRDTKRPPSASQATAVGVPEKQEPDLEALHQLIPNMERSGKSLEDIARDLELPLAHVRLLAKLYAEKTR